jgi:hypothetical protein
MFNRLNEIQTTGALSLGVKWLEREVDHSPPSSAEVKEAIPPLPQYAFMAWFSAKTQGQLYLHVYTS